MARCTRLGWSLFVPLLCAVPAMAQWRQVPAVGSPPVRTGFSLLPYPNGGLLLFGGDENNAAATEWRWSGTEWTPQATPVPRRRGHASAVHTPTGDLFVFGGLGAGAVPLTDTWRLHGSTWTQVQTTNSPPFFADSSMAYDARSDAMVLV